MWEAQTSLPAATSVTHCLGGRLSFLRTKTTLAFQPHALKVSECSSLCSWSMRSRQNIREPARHTAGMLRCLLWVSQQGSALYSLPAWVSGMTRDRTYFSSISPEGENHFSHLLHASDQKDDHCYGADTKCTPKPMRQSIGPPRPLKVALWWGGRIFKRGNRRILGFWGHVSEKILALCPLLVVASWLPGGE